jgi:oxygen-dependent protoporphyrinogen oxidase
VSGEPVFTRVYRMPQAGVQLEVGHLHLMRETEARLEGLKGLFMSAAGLRGVGIADCVGDARTQAIAAADYVHTVRGKERIYASAAGC